MVYFYDVMVDDVGVANHLEFFEGGHWVRDTEGHKVKGRYFDLNRKKQKTKKKKSPKPKHQPPYFEKEEQGTILPELRVKSL